MSYTRRLFLRKATSTTVILAAQTSLATRLFADCKSNTTLLRIGAPFPDPKLGDCEMRSFSMNLGPSGEGGFRAEVCTHFTHTKDVWHMRLRLCSRVRANPQQIQYFTDHTFDGPQMSEKDVPLFHLWTENFRFDPALLKLPSIYDGLIMQITNCC